MTLNEKYIKDYNERFAKKVIVSDEYLDSTSFINGQNACSYKQINDWTQRWIFENGGVQINEEQTPIIKCKLTFDLGRCQNE